LAVVPAGVAGAQTLPWPTDSPRPGGMAAKPAMPAAPAASGAAAQMPGSVAPLGGFSAPPPQPFAGGGGFSAPPPQQLGGGGAPPPCFIEFTKMREDVEKKGRAAKALSERKPPREELCKQITVFATAEAKWVKFAEANVASCGIPKEVAQQLKTMHGNTEQARERICSGGPAAAPPAPSLSDALGTVQMPLPETTKSGGGGAFDTLTGNILQR
jgi:hypothetical protein